MKSATSLIRLPSIGSETVNEPKPPTYLGTDCFDLTLCKDHYRWDRACGARRFIAFTSSYDEAFLSIAKNHSDLSALENADRLLLSSPRRVLRKGCCPKSEPNELYE